MDGFLALVWIAFVIVAAFTVGAILLNIVIVGIGFVLAGIGVGIEKVIKYFKGE